VNQNEHAITVVTLLTKTLAWEIELVLKVVRNVLQEQLIAALKNTHLFQESTVELLHVAFHPLRGQIDESLTLFWVEGYSFEQF